MEPRGKGRLLTRGQLEEGAFPRSLRGITRARKVQSKVKEIEESMEGCVSAHKGQRVTSLEKLAGVRQSSLCSRLKSWNVIL